MYMLCINEGVRCDDKLDNSLEVEQLDYSEEVYAYDGKHLVCGVTMS